jgi:protocatechuate 3,4-dioxygenase beta subunit
VIAGRGRADGRDWQRNAPRWYRAAHFHAAVCASSFARVLSATAADEASRTHAHGSFFDELQARRAAEASRERPQ